MDLRKYFRSEIVEMAPYKPGEQPGGGKVIKLNTNESPYPPSPRIRDAILAASERLERYPDPLGTSFRRGAADVLGVSPDHILCGNGSDDILTILTRALVGPGDRIRFPFPSYILYRTLANIQGATYEEIPFDRGFGLTEAFFLPHPNLKLVFVPNPNSPSGTLLPPETFLDLAQKLDCPVVIDEAYVDFAPRTCVDLVAQDPRILVTRTFSKSHALAGLRFGYLIAHPSIVEMLRKVKDSYNTDSISIAGATAAISDQDWLRNNVAKMNSTRARMETTLRDLGFQVTPSHANFLWCTRDDRPVEPIYSALKSRGILVRYMDYPPWGDGLRISVGTDSEIDAMLFVLGEILNRRVA
jgi:histidinol-phosphate aminotransferase